MAGNASIVVKDGIFQVLCGPHHSTLNVHTLEEASALCTCFSGAPGWHLAEGIPAKGQSLTQALDFVSRYTCLHPIVVPAEGLRHGAQKPSEQDGTKGQGNKGTSYPHCYLSLYPATS